MSSDCFEKQSGVHEDFVTMLTSCTDEICRFEVIKTSAIENTIKSTAGNTLNKIVYNT